VLFVEEMANWLSERKAAKIYLNAGVNSDSGMENMLPEEKHLIGL